jgi:predicted nucleotidyltransferase
MTSLKGDVDYSLQKKRARELCLQVQKMLAIPGIYGMDKAMIPSSSRSPLPPVVSDLVNRISAFPGVQQVILYGSRARGTNSDLSDIDLAVTGVKDRREWTRIHQLADIETSLVRTLLKIDLVRFEEVDPSVQQSIRKEGRVLYERC